MHRLELLDTLVNNGLPTEGSTLNMRACLHEWCFPEATTQPGSSSNAVQPAPEPPAVAGRPQAGPTGAAGQSTLCVGPVAPVAALGAAHRLQLGITDAYGSDSHSEETDKALNASFSHFEGDG